jgi:kinesin family protein 1
VCDWCATHVQVVASLEGFNTCVLAYGQTGSGKSYSMMGSNTDKGIIPRICEHLFERLAGDPAAPSDPASLVRMHKVVVSFCEIYQEAVIDLLRQPGASPAKESRLRVREHKTTGPYVEGLAQLTVNSYADIAAAMERGGMARTVGATNMNESSSRSHAIFTVTITTTAFDPATRSGMDKTARMCLVDLAGSERQDSTGATGIRLKEASMINTSLSTLGRVINALAKGAGKLAPPYRESVLTWLLKENLGGNAKTTMLATISPVCARPLVVLCVNLTTRGWRV